MNLAMDAVPEGVDIAKIQARLARFPGVTDVHDLHVWGPSTTQTALTAHLVVSAGAAAQDLLTDAIVVLHEELGIEHATLQMELRAAVGCCKLPGGS